MSRSSSVIRLTKVASHLNTQPVSAEHDYIKEYRSLLLECKKDLLELIDRINCNPILVRLAWHDAGTFDRTVKRFPECGGANASIRFPLELSHAANAGLTKAIKYLKPLKDKYPTLSFADIIQLASVTAIEHSGGPVIPIRFGRIDTNSEDECPEEGRLPGATPPFGDGSPDAGTHLRRVFYRMGFNDQEIVVLSGAHTLGRAFKERSGTTENYYGAKGGTKYTKMKENRPRFDKKKGLGMQGGRSWTKNWLTFDNEIFGVMLLSEEEKAQLLQLPTDKVIFVDKIFKKYAEYYRENKKRFFKDYVKAHAKLAELGSVFRPEKGFYL